MNKGITRSPASVIVFSILTLGIYYLYWLYKFAAELKAYLNDQSLNPGMELVFCFFCGPYQLYWLYKYGKSIARAQAQVGLPTDDNSVLYIILALFGLGFVSMAIMQSSVNKVWEMA